MCKEEEPMWEEEYPPVEWSPTLWGETVEDLVWHSQDKTIICSPASVVTI